MSEAASQPEPEPPSPAGVVAKPRADWGGRALAVALVALVGVAAGLLLAPAGAHRLPGPDALGTPAQKTFKADRDYEIVDEEATARRRAGAADAEPPVYDLEEGAGEEAAARIHAAFELMRAEEAALPPPPARGGDELLRRYAGLRDQFVSRLQVVLRDGDLAALAQARFSPQVERDLAALAQRGVDGMVVEDVQLLPAERERGLVVRTFRGRALQGERMVLDLALVRSVEQARAEVAHAAAARLDREPPPLREAITRLAAAMVRPTLEHNQGETERRKAEAAARVKPVGVTVKRGEKIIGDGERIEPRHLLVFDGMRAQRRGEALGQVGVGGGALVALLVVLLWSFAHRSLKGFRPARRDALLMAVLLLVTLGLGALALSVADAVGERFAALPAASVRYLVPFAAGAMIVRQVLSAETALLFSVAAGVCAGLLAGQSVPYALYALLTSLAAAGLVAGSRDRAGLFRAGVGVGALGAALAAFAAAYAGKGVGEAAVAAVAAFAGGAVLLPVVVAGVLPAVEALFGYVTDVKLLELANLNHPALKELIVQAPGTYHHSILMGAMVEAAAQAIGANPLLAKVCAYYHDIGKIRNPLYFAENQRGENRHDALAPSMSALIVKRHVTDGLELARHWRLPSAVADAIPQHHGTRLVGYFWAKAQRLAGVAGAAGPGESGRSPIDESLFRYPGPRPRTREAALVMIADACEASARSLENPTREALAALVQKRVNEVFSEGQLDECDLTLRDLNAIGGAMVSALEAIYHSRPQYPGRRDAPGAPPVQLVADP